jgi:hypothetical protein
MPRARFVLRDVATKTMEHRWRPDVDSVDADVIAAMGRLDVEKGGIEALARIDLGQVMKGTPGSRGIAASGGGTPADRGAAAAAEDDAAIEAHEHARDMHLAAVSAARMYGGPSSTDAAQREMATHRALVATDATTKLRPKYRSHGAEEAVVQAPYSMSVAALHAEAAKHHGDAVARLRGGSANKSLDADDFTAADAGKTGPAPEDVLKPKVVAAYRQWAASKPSQPASAFAKTLAGALAKTDDGKAAVSSLGGEAEFEAWVVQVMKYEAGGKDEDDVAKSLDVKHLTDLEDHPDYEGFGYLGHSRRTPRTDRELVSAANEHGLGHHQLAALVLNRAGRHMGDELHGTSPAERKAIYRRYMTDPKTRKHYGLDEYAATLKGGDGASKSLDADPVGALLALCDDAEKGVGRGTSTWASIDLRRAALGHELEAKIHRNGYLSAGDEGSRVKAIKAHRDAADAWRHAAEVHGGDGDGRGYAQHQLNAFINDKHADWLEARKPGQDVAEKGRTVYPPDSVFGRFGVKQGDKLMREHSKLLGKALEATKAAHAGSSPKTVEEHLAAIGPHLDAALAHEDSARMYDDVYGPAASGNNRSRGTMLHHVNMAKYHHDKATGKIPLDQD